MFVLSMVIYPIDVVTCDLTLTELFFSSGEAGEKTEKFPNADSGPGNGERF